MPSLASPLLREMDVLLERDRRLCSSDPLSLPLPSTLEPRVSCDRLCTCNLEGILSRRGILVLSVTPFQTLELSLWFADASAKDSISVFSSAVPSITSFFSRSSSLPGDLFLELGIVVFPECHCLGPNAANFKSSLTIGWGRLSLLGEMGDFDAAFRLASFGGDLVIEFPGE